MRVAILGAGTTGVCAALELSARGHDVDLYDENAVPISRAGFHNEGKIHLGLLYAKDRSLRTTATMIDGALRFASTLERWIDFDPGSVTLSTPFYYGVHRDTMLDVDELRAHYDRCARLFEARRDANGRYLGLERSIRVDEVPATEVERVVDPEHVVALFRTNERSVDPQVVAARLRDAVRSSARLRFVPDTRVVDVSRRAAGFEVCARHADAALRESYDQVVNTLWHGRLAIDDRLGIRPTRAWLYRYKLANRIAVPLTPEAVPSITCVLGPFGDLVNFGPRGLFLSWYPCGMLAMSGALRPPDWENELTPSARYAAFRRSYAEWLQRCPKLAALAFEPDDVTARGGVIFAWGSSDIDEPTSELHARSDVGVHSSDGYHSVNTGKYTLAPSLGLRVAERVLGVG